MISPAKPGNSSEPARSPGVGDKTVPRYLDIREDSYMAWRLHPWQLNLGKREVKAPKVYLADTGILHNLLGIGGTHELLAHPKSGPPGKASSSRESFAQPGLITTMPISGACIPARNWSC